MPGHVWLSATPWTAAHQASLSFTISLSFLKLMSISSSVTPCSSCPQSFPTSGSFPMSWFFTSSAQSIGASASTSVLPMNIQGWFPLGLTGLISSLSSPRDSLESSPAPQSKSINTSELSLLYGPTLTSVHDYWKNHSFDYIVGKVIAVSCSVMSYRLQPMDCSPPGSSVHGILQARILEWVAISSSQLWMPIQIIQGAFKNDWGLCPMADPLTQERGLQKSWRRIFKAQVSPFHIFSCVWISRNVQILDADSFWVDQSWDLRWYTPNKLPADVHATGQGTTLWIASSRNSQHSSFIFFFPFHFCIQWLIQSFFFCSQSNLITYHCFPSDSDGKECACNAGDLGSIPGLGRSPSEGNGNPFQHSCLENPMGRGAWWAIVHVTKIRTWLSY